jgi:hypothetical protein
MSAIKSLSFSVCPQDQGQIVEVAYAGWADRDLIVRRRHDRSDGDVSYTVATWSDDEEFAPQSGAVPADRRFRELTASERRLLGLAG